MKLEFKVVDRKNWEDCIELDVFANQKEFVADNAYSILEAQFYPNLYPYGIYNNDELVGFFMYGLDDETGHWEMSRFMIAKQFQKKGFGREALRQFLDMMREKLGKIEFYTSIEPKNSVAQKLYEEVGFAKTGEIMWDEEVMKIQL